MYLGKTEAKSAQARVDPSQLMPRTGSVAGGCGPSPFRNINPKVRFMGNAAAFSGNGLGMLATLLLLLIPEKIEALQVTHIPSIVKCPDPFHGYHRHLF